MDKQLMTFTVNGIEKEVFVRNADTLINTLRNQLGLTGAKPACNNGDCGACTVLVDGLPLNSCHTLTIENFGKTITTIEGLSDSVLQQKFVENWAVQCGYCTPGFILNCLALIESEPDVNDAMIDEWLDSNICRCTGYEEIKQTVKQLVQMKKVNG